MRRKVLILFSSKPGNLFSRQCILCTGIDIARAHQQRGYKKSWSHEAAVQEFAPELDTVIQRMAEVFDAISKEPVRRVRASLSTIDHPRRVQKPAFLSWPVQGGRKMEDVCMVQRSVVELDAYSVVDEERILSCGVDDEFLQGLLKEFIVYYGDAPSQLHDLVAKNESAKVFKLLHTIKGGSASIGLVQIANATGHLEEILKEEGVAACTKHIDSLAEAIKNLSGYLQQKKDSSDPETRGEGG